MKFERATRLHETNYRLILLFTLCCNTANILYARSSRTEALNNMNSSEMLTPFDEDSLEFDVAGLDDDIDDSELEALLRADNFYDDDYDSDDDDDDGDDDNITPEHDTAVKTLTHDYGQKLDLPSSVTFAETLWQRVAAGINNEWDNLQQADDRDKTLNGLFEKELTALLKEPHEASNVKSVRTELLNMLYEQAANKRSESTDADSDDDDDDDLFDYDDDDDDDEEDDD